MLWRTVAVVALVIGGLGPVRSGADSAAIEQVIEDQMNAFRAGDPVAAFEFASPNIRGLFGTPENFGRMVASGYPSIWQPGAVRFLGLSERGGRLQQRVEVTDAQGRTHLFDYEMIPTEAGWKINGVRPVAAADVGV